MPTWLGRTEAGSKIFAAYDSVSFSEPMKNRFRRVGSTKHTGFEGHGKVLSSTLISLTPLCAEALGSGELNVKIKLPLG